MSDKVEKLHAKVLKVPIVYNNLDEAYKYKPSSKGTFSFVVAVSEEKLGGLKKMCSAVFKKLGVSKETAKELYAEKIKEPDAKQKEYDTIGEGDKLVRLSCGAKRPIITFPPKNGKKPVDYDEVNLGPGAVVSFLASAVPYPDEKKPENGKMGLYCNRILVHSESDYSGGMSDDEFFDAVGDEKDLKTPEKETSDDEFEDLSF